MSSYLKGEIHFEKSIDPVCSAVLLTFGVPMFAAFHTQGSSDLVSLLHSAVLTAPIL